MQNLVIVESPTKARTLTRFLGKDYEIIASMGHVRDLPKSELAIDVENNFEPKYIIPRDKRKKVNELKKLLGEAKVLWLATDPDREGEAIAWHLAELQSNSKGKGQKAKGKSVKQEVHRVEFHEITPEAIKDAFAHPRDLDMQLVNAQQARRVLDRLVGYKLSPLLWAKIKRGLSAGRVQSVALRLIVEREREVIAFKPVEYWSIEAQLESTVTPVGNPAHLLSNASVLRTSSSDSLATLVSDRGVRRSPPSAGTFVAALIEQNGKKLEINSGKQAKEHLANLENANYQISKVVKKEMRRSPAPPFTTSTLQQVSSNRLGYTAKKTMMLAQNLYEQGLITYMRTDSVNLAASAVEAVREYIVKELGKEYLPTVAKLYKSKQKNSQEAHEAIRPTDVRTQSGEFKKNDLTSDHMKLYDLIWKRFVACQINEAVFDQTSVDVIASKASQSRLNKQSLRSNDLQDSDVSGLSPNPRNDNYTFRANGSVIKFDGWMKVYGKATDEEKEGEEDKRLPELSEGEILKLLELLPGQHFTEPPARFTEASLIKKMEELGIGRPSTYAPILSTIQDRYYVERFERKFTPTPLGFTVIDFLMKYFADIFDYQFTAGMEDALDSVSRGEREWQPVIREFYEPFEKKLESTSELAEKMVLEVEHTGKMCPECGKELIVRTGKFGKFLACSGFPECKHTEAIEEKIDAKCPTDGGDIVVRRTKTGRTFYGCKNYPKCTYATWNKPKSESETQADLVKSKTD